jgi:hypothetical protein
LIYNFREVILEHGIDLAQLRKIAATYDILREASTQSGATGEQNSESSMKSQFAKKVNLMIEKTKGDRFQ